MKKSSVWSTRTIAEIGIFAALGYVLDFLAGTYSASLFPNGGSIGIAMICVFIVAFRRGSIAGLITGLLMGLLDMADGFYSIASTWNAVLGQILLDYVVAYAFAGFGAGLFRTLIVKANKKSLLITYVTIACIVGGLLKLLAHFLSGYIFWNTGVAEGWENFLGQPALYSFVYNGAYMLPCIVLSTLIMDVIASSQPSLITDYNTRFIIANKNLNENPGRISYEALVTLVASGIFFVFSLVYFIKSFSFEDYGADGKDYSFSKENLVCTIAGLIGIVISLIWFFKEKKHATYSIKYLGSILLLMGAVIFFYYLGVIIESEQGFNVYYETLKFVVGLIMFGSGLILSFTNFFTDKRALN